MTSAKIRLYRPASGNFILFKFPKLGKASIPYLILCLEDVECLEKKSSTSSDLSLLYVGSSPAGRRPSFSRRGSGSTVFGTGTRFKSQSESEKGPPTNQPELGVFHLNL